MSKYTEAIARKIDEENYYHDCMISYLDNEPISKHYKDMMKKASLELEALEIADRLEYAYHNAFGIDLAKCTKYGNESAEQQRDSYSTVMMYEVANVFDDILGI